MKIIESLKNSKKALIAAICGILVVSAVGVSTAGTAQAKEIGPEKAAAVALSNAGFKESEVKKLVSSYDKEDGQGVYEVDFYAGGNEYDYVVSAKDGKVIEVKKEKMDAEDYKEAGLEVPEALKPKAEAKKSSSKSEAKQSSTSTAAAVKPTASKASTSSQSSQYIGVSAAKKAALKHAGVSSSDAVFEKAKLEKDDGRYEYEVDFKAKGYEYDYEIDAKSGKILSADKEKDDDAVAKKPAQSTSSSNSGSSNISKDAAKNAALKHAGVSSSDAVFEKVELDKDDGRYEYEVDFKAKGYEYDYEIDAKSGKILKADKEKDDDAVAKKPAQSTSSSNSGSSNISKDAAKNAALKHAGVSASNAVFEKVELDKDDGKVKYEIEFRSGGVEYEYEIDAKSGKVLSAESEREDRD